MSEHEQFSFKNMKKNYIDTMYAFNWEIKKRINLIEHLNHKRLH